MCANEQTGLAFAPTVIAEGEIHMLRNIKNLEGCAIGVTDGPIGHVKDSYFDDEGWVAELHLMRRARSQP